jgi:hypothetical protein
MRLTAEAQLYCDRKPRDETGPTPGLKAALPAFISLTTLEAAMGAMTRIPAAGIGHPSGASSLHHEILPVSGSAGRIAGRPWSKENSGHA